MDKLTLFGSLILLGGCFEGKEEDDESGSDGLLGNLHQDDTGFVPSPDAPVITSADVYCDYTECWGQNSYYWVPVVEFTEPQGIANIAMDFEGLSVYDANGSFLFTETLYCGTGRCSARWSEYDRNMWCNQAEGYTMVFQLIDDNGNLSAPVTLVVDAVQ